LAHGSLDIPGSGYTKGQPVPDVEIAFRTQTGDVDKVMSVQFDMPVCYPTKIVGPSDRTAIHEIASRNKNIIDAGQCDTMIGGDDDVMAGSVGTKSALSDPDRPRVSVNVIAPQEHGAAPDPHYRRVPSFGGSYTIASLKSFDSPYAVRSCQRCSFGKTGGNAGYECRCVCESQRSTLRSTVGRKDQ